MATFLSNSVFRDLILPFVLLFVLIFAVLEKSKLLGEGKQQINALVSLALAAIAVSTFSTQIEWLQKFAIFLVIALFILFIFMLLYGFAYSGKEGFELAKGWKMLIAAIAFIAVIVASLIITNTWDRVYDFFTSSSIGTNVVLIIIIVAAVAAVLYGGKKKE